MKLLPRSVLLSLLLCSSLAFAADPKSLPGVYTLSGASEVGSQLQLTADGKFRWMMSYGNQDIAAAGVWEMKGERIVLTSQREPLRFRLFRVRELKLQKEPKAGTWVAIVGVPSYGPISDVEVKFEAKSGKTSVASSLPNGDAIVTMPASETWVRAGLRRKGSKEEYQWIKVPPERAAARIAGFALENTAALQNGFDTMELTQDGNALVRADEDGGRWRYVKEAR